MLRTARHVCFLAALAAAEVSRLHAQVPPLIPRSVLYENPERTAPQISPDGRLLAYLAPDSGVLNVWVRTLGKDDARAVTRDRKRPIFQYYWQGDSKHILHLQDQGGNENYRLYQTDVRTRAVRDLTPLDSVQTQVVAIDPAVPNRMIIALNRRDPRFHDAYALDLTTAQMTLVAQNPGDVAGWTADNALVVRVAQAQLPDGGTELRVRDGDGPWRVLRRESADETFGGVVGFSADNRMAWIISSVDANAARLLQIDLATGATIPIAGDAVFDVGGVLLHPTKRSLQAVSFTRQRLEWEAVDPALATDLQRLKGFNQGDWSLQGRSLDDTKWVVAYDVSDGPVHFYLYDRTRGTADLLFVHRPKLLQYTLAPMDPIEFTASDGMKIYGYLTLPPGRGRTRLPLVLYPHGGPWGRDTWGYNRDVQLLANRGYAVLLVNFRGSTGFGKAYLNAGDREWAGKMQQDLLDAVDYVVRQDIVDPQRVCIMGGSYGGYATLVGVTFTPDRFACGVSIVGPSNLVTLMQSIPPYWEAFRAVFRKRMGDAETEPDFLLARSPLTKADQIRVPLLVAQGANDPRVKQAESDQIVSAARQNGKEVLYLVFPDEGHGFANPANNLKFYAAAEGFLAKYLGGRAEPPGPGEEFEALTQ